MTLFKRIKIEVKNFNLLFPKKDKAIILSVIFLVSLLLILYSPLTDRFERKALDWKCELNTSWINTEVVTDTIILAIDSETLRNAPYKWPWPQDYWAKIIASVSTNLEPEMLLLDIYFQERGSEKESSAAFAQAIKKSGQVGLVAVFEEHFSSKGQQVKFFPPIKDLKNAAKFWGMSQFPIDSDGVIRSFLLFDFRLEKLHVAWEACKKLKNFNVSDDIFDSMKSARAILNFKSDERRIPRVSLQKVLRADFNYPRLKGRNVIIGATAPILHDYHQTPVGIINGPELVGNSIDTLKNGRIQFIETSWTNRAFHFLLGVILAFIPFLDCFKRIWIPVVVGMIFLPLFLIFYSFYPLIHPPIAITYIAFFIFSWLLLIVIRLNELNRIQQSLHEAEICGNIQQKFFPTKILSVEPGFSAAGRCIPYQNAGGDYYDYFKNKQGNVFFFLGDVAGHGISASMLTTAAKSVVLINSAKESFEVPDLFLDINSAILNLTKRRLLSAVSGIVDFTEQKIILYSAGHLPAVLKTPDGVTEYPIAGLPLGVSKRFKLQEFKELPIPECGKLFVYSDGIVEAVNWENEQIGFDKFYEMIEKMPMELSVEESLDYLYQQLDLHVEGRAYEDDVTFLILSFDKREVSE